MYKVKAPAESSQELTDREVGVLQLLGMGQANKQIAGSLYIGVSERKRSRRTSRVYWRSSECSDKRTQAALHPVRIGLVSIDKLNEKSW